jgi:hypothetical protein
MTDYHSIPELMENYLQTNDGAGLWVTEPEFRTYFAMDEYSSPAISGFFRRFSMVRSSWLLPGNKNRKTDGNHTANTDDQTLL